MRTTFLSMRFLAFILVLVAACCRAGELETKAAARGRKLNVVLILADDLGFETIGANGGTSYRTPVLDKLAATGVRFTHCYAQPLCTPTRVQLMTGRSNVRNYINFGNMVRGRDTTRLIRRPASRNSYLEANRGPKQ